MRLQHHISPALANLRVRETLANLALRDPPTGLFKRRYFQESPEREVHRVRHFVLRQ